MKLSFLNHGNHNNLHVIVRSVGIKFKLIFFFNTYHAYIVKSIKKNYNTKVDFDKLYNDLKEVVAEKDFVLITPRNKMMKHKFGTTKQLLHYINR